MISIKRHYILLAIIAIALLLISPVHCNDDTTEKIKNDKPQFQCERLPTSLTYKQDAAPADVSAILRVVVEKINRDVTGVVDVEVKWSGGELHKKVGERIVQCFVTRLATDAGTAESTLDEHGRNVVTQCFEVPFTILDVNECTVPQTNAMHHKCMKPSICVNTLGSYECVCPSESSTSVANTASGRKFVADSFWNELNQETRNPWELALSSGGGSCSNLPSTYLCCDEDGSSKEGSSCRSSFRCPVDPCTAKSNCSEKASCQRTESPNYHPNYQCQCPAGLMGNGLPCRKNVRRKLPKVKYDGKTPTEETRKLLESGMICDCSEPTIDACDGFPKCPGKHEVCKVDDSTNTPGCVCQDGYDRDPDYGCVDESPPILNIRPDPTHGTDKRTGITHLSQGDKYEEYGVDIIDDNAEEYLRSLKIAYSRPLPQGCLLEMGEFYVEYTVATPWTEPNFVRAKRTVVIDNANECLVKQGMGVGANCPELVAQCDVEAGARCKDEIGTYTCQCPSGTEGDGFLPIPRLKSNGKGGFDGSMVPRGYKGGSGCRDTSAPVLEILGPNPKRFRVAKASGIKGLMKMDENEDSNARVEALVSQQRGAYETDIKYIISTTSGAELCATTAKRNVRPTDCIRAEDKTYKGIVDLSSRVTVGEPVPKNNGSPLQWKVPYNVMDEAGNKAKTVWRDIIVEEVDIDDFDKKAKVDESTKSNESRDGRNNKRECPPCNCKSEPRQQQRGNSGMSPAECNAQCESKIAEAIASSSDGSSDKTCTPTNGSGEQQQPNHQVIQEMLVFLEGMLGPNSMMLLLLGCTLATMIYIISRGIAALFFSTGPHTQTYYHSRDDDEQEKLMLQSVSYYRSPTASSASNGSRGQSPAGSSISAASSSGARPPPRASISSQTPRNGMYNGNGSTPRQQQQRSPFQSNDGTDNIYQTMSPITPSRQNGTTPQGGNRYNLRNAR